MNDTLSSGVLSLRYRVEENRLDLLDTERNDRLFTIPGAALLTPRGTAGTPKVTADETTLRLEFANGATVCVERAEPGFRIRTRFTPKQETELTRLDLLPAGSGLAAYQAVNFRNRHHTDAVWPELLLGDKVRTNTFSTDWQFAPHPTAMLFTRNDTQLFWGATEPPKDGFGLYLDCRHFRIEDFSVHFGEPGCGTVVAAGETWESPEFRLFVRRDTDPFAAYAAFGKILVREGKIADPVNKRRFDWHREHVYCTWLDQGVLSRSTIAADLAEQAAAAAGSEEQPVCRILTETLVRRAVEIIKREKLPFRTILLDEGWSVARGQWEFHPERFPNPRKLVDDLHRDGFKVVVWWNWAEIAKRAEPSVCPEHLTANGKRNRHGCLTRDYSKPVTQEEYLKPLFHKLFSSDPGCCNLDGIKTDFLADKVHPDLPCENPEWRGEENYFRHVYELFMTELRRNKPDAMHIGCAGNYFLAEYIDINRTYDVANDNYMEHVNRAKMLRSTTPGTPVVFDMHGKRSNYREFLRSARELDCPVHIGTVFALSDDLLDDVYKPMDAADYAMFREEL